MAVLGGLLLGIAAPYPIARAHSEARTYEVDRIEASWVVPRRADNGYRLFKVEGARFEDLQSGGVQSFARAEWLNCQTQGDGLVCGGGPAEFEVLTGTPATFEFDDDLSAAVLAFDARGDEQRAQLTTHDLITRPFDFVPGTLERSESCNAAGGFGRGIYRSMRASGALFNRRLRIGQSHETTAVARYVLHTECDPEEWWHASLRSETDRPDI